MNIRHMFFASLLLPAGLFAQSTVFSDTFADGERSTQNLPVSVAWYHNRPGTSILTVKSGALDVNVANDVRVVWAYFPAVTLNVGDSLTLSLDFSFTSSADGGFRLALLNTNGVTPQASDVRGGPTGNYQGYGVFAGGASNRTTIYKRDGVFASSPDSTLLDSLGSGPTSIWSSHATGPGIGGPGVANTPYTVVLKVTRTGANTAVVSSQFQGDGVTTNGNVSLSDAASITARFDTVALDFIGSSLAGDMLVTRAALTVSSAPVFTVQPVSRGVFAGASALFIAEAAGNPAPTYQWQRKAAGSTVWANLPESATYSGTTTSALQINGTLGNMDGDQFRATSANGLVSVTSDPATLAIVTPGAAGRIVNLSILTALTAAGDSFTLGYTVGGSGTEGTKPLVIRAVGPSLGALGVANTLGNPKMEFYAGSTKTGENDDWGGDDAIKNAMAAVGAFSYATKDSKDAAAFASLPKGSNSVIVSASGGGIGTVLAEVYDATPTTGGTATTPRLTNVSVLKPIGDVLTVGFTLGGSSPKPVLIRAVGPTLVAFGIGGTLADPRLAVFNSVDPTPIAQNDDWGGAAAVAAAITQTGAFGLQPTSKDAALVVTLAPGGYTVQVTGAGGGMGAALVEIYELP